MDMRKYGTTFIKPDDVRSGSLQDRIVNVYTGEKFGDPVLELESGDKFSVNKTNTRILAKAYGWESSDWHGQVIELELGHYLDRDDGQQKETVTVRPISVRQPSADNGGTKAVVKRDDLNDEIPF